MDRPPSISMTSTGERPRPQWQHTSAERPAMGMRFDSSQIKEVDDDDDDGNTIPFFHKELPPAIASRFVEMLKTDTTRYYPLVPVTNVPELLKFKEFMDDGKTKRCQSLKDGPEAGVQCETPANLDHPCFWCNFHAWSGPPGLVREREHCTMGVDDDGNECFVLPCGAKVTTQDPQTIEQIKSGNYIALGLPSVLAPLTPKSFSRLATAPIIEEVD